MPDTFIEMSTDLDKADDNLGLVKDSMSLMSENVSLISESLSQYQMMISQSKTSTDNLSSMLTNFKNNIGNIINIASIVLILFFLWLLATQVVIFSQGYELYQGTASGMASSQSEEETQKDEPELAKVNPDETSEKTTNETNNQ